MTLRDLAETLVEQSEGGWLFEVHKDTAQMDPDEPVEYWTWSFGAPVDDTHQELLWGQTEQGDPSPVLEYVAAANPEVILELLDRFDALAEIHFKQGQDFGRASKCRSCGYVWPCPSARALKLPE